MAEPINVIFVADTKELGLLDNNFGKKYNLKLVCRTSDPNEALKAAQTYKNPVVVVRVQEPAGVEKLITELAAKKVMSVGVCRTAKEGFLLLQYGAAEMITRSDREFLEGGQMLENVLSVKIKTAYAKYFEDSSRPLKHEYGAYSKVIAIGSSTGGTETVLEILKALPADAPPVLIVQHMPPVFTRLYAERLHSSCQMSVWEAQDGDVLRRGLALLAPGDLQMRLVRRSDGYSVCCERGEKRTGHCPSVDNLFESVAQAAGDRGIGVILTGMGRDGADGLLQMRQAGAMTFGQNEESCVVYGMPKEAYDIGAVTKQLPAEAIAGAILACL